MYRRKIVATGVFSIIGTILIAGLIVGNTALSADDDGAGGALVNKAPEKSNLIIDCSFGEDGKKNCGVQHVFQLSNNVMKLLLWIAITGAGLLIFYKGTKLTINVFIKGGHQQARQEVQSALRATLIGLLFILGAYLLVKAGFDIIGYNLNGGDPFRWNESSLPTP